MENQKKAYAKPEIEVNAYAQFENVYAGCSKVDTREGCFWQPDLTADELESGSNNHKNLIALYSG